MDMVKVGSLNVGAWLNTFLQPGTVMMGEVKELGRRKKSSRRKLKRKYILIELCNWKIMNSSITRHNKDIIEFKSIFNEMVLDNAMN